jgi:hypothetical protein
MIGPIGLIILLLCIIAFYVSWWESRWRVTAGAQRVQDVDVSQFGQTPTLYWIDNPLQLLLVPEQWFNAQQNDTQVLVVELENRITSWHPADTLNIDNATLVEIPTQSIREEHNSIVLPDLPKGGQVELKFSGVSLVRPIYDFIGFPDGSRGWELQRSYFGQVNILIRDIESGPEVVKLSKTIINTESLPDIYSLINILTGKKFLLFRADLYGDKRIFILGPFENR